MTVCPLARHNNGLADFKRRLAAIPKAIKLAVEPALDASADEMVTAQRSLAPRDDGDLINSIKWRRDGELRREITAGGPTTTRPVRKGLDADYDYALAMEFGTREIPAHSFFWPGYRLTRKKTRARIRRAVTKAVKDNYGK